MVDNASDNKPPATNRNSPIVVSVSYLTSWPLCAKYADVKNVRSAHFIGWGGQKAHHDVKVVSNEPVN